MGSQRIYISGYDINETADSGTIDRVISVKPVIE